MTPADQVDSTRLGASYDGQGTHFVVPSPGASGVELCLWPDDQEQRVPMERHADGIWRTFVAGLLPGARYAFRANGKWDPSRGLLFNRAKLLLDPCARMVDGSVVWHDALRGGSGDDGSSADLRDSAPHLPRAVVVGGEFDWQNDRAPRTPWTESVIYECHVRGLTRLHPDIPDGLRGTFLGLTTEPVLAHFHRLGITAIELLPVTPVAPDARSAALGLTNYWGYNPYNWFALDPRLAADPLKARDEFREMVRRLHTAGLEVILDVVLNHSGEGNRRGPTLSLRGLDNALFYRLDGAGAYEDITGCGNALDFRQPLVRRLALESLQYWAGEMHVDGFRFDLAPVLGRDGIEFSRAAPFFEELQADPILRPCKLIAEPWDLGPNGYRVGQFPPPWAEWNDRFRDGVRRFWRGTGSVSDLATRLAGSSDLFATSHRLPQASISCVACHDGFTLRDLVTYTTKHNEANGESNRDGRDLNESSAWGPEGPSNDPEVVERRERVMRAMLATVALSLGVPMLAHGDERGRTQRGNNNAYCHDSPLTWIDWRSDDVAEALTAFAAQCFAVRRRWPVLRAAQFRRAEGDGEDSVTWLNERGRPLAEADWHDADRRLLIARHGGAVPLLMILNSDANAVLVQLPDGPWRVELATAGESREGNTVGGTLSVAAHTLLLLSANPGATY